MSVSDKHIPYGKHYIDNDDIASVVEVLEQHFLTQGAKVPEFERVLCDYTGASYCTAVNSGTSGLHIACLAANVGSGDIVWTSANSFVASANCALYCGASVDFVDIDPHSRNICLHALAYKLSQAEQQDKLPKAIVVVHFSGQSCDMKAISDMVSAYNIIIIEDAAHALGAHYGTQKVGACEFSDMAVFSFHPVKSITTAEGGAVTTNNKHYAHQLALYAKHGITRDAESMSGSKQGPWYYQQLVLGYNYRLSDLQAALGISQMVKLDSFIEKRQLLADKYFNALATLPVQLPCKTDSNCSSWHVFTITLTQHNRDHVYAQLQAMGIGVNVHYIPVHLHPYYAALGFKEGDFPVAEHYYYHALTLPLYVQLTDAEQNRVIEALHQVLG